jgi:hypothetical protein
VVRSERQIFSLALPTGRATPNIQGSGFDPLAKERARQSVPASRAAGVLHRSGQAV